jgi:hypothetical protein
MVHLITLPLRRERARGTRLPSLIRRRPAPHQMAQGQGVVDLGSCSQTHHPLTPPQPSRGAVFMAPRRESRGECSNPSRICTSPIRDRPYLPSNGFVTSPPGSASSWGHHLAVGAQAVLGVHAPADAAIGARNRGVRLRFNEHPLGT